MTTSPVPTNSGARAGRVLGLLALMFAIVSLVLVFAGALVAAVNFLLWLGIIIIWIPGILSIVGIIVSAVGLAGAPVKGDRPIAIRGLIFSIIAFVLPILAIVIAAVFR